jgi:hypothetical protein
MIGLCQEAKKASWRAREEREKSTILRFSQLAFLPLGGDSSMALREIGAGKLVSDTSAPPV